MVWSTSAWVVEIFPVSPNKASAKGSERMRKPWIHSTWTTLPANNMVFVDFTTCSVFGVRLDQDVPLRI